MPYTDQSDVYSAVHEDGVNTLIDHLRRKRPSLFNYATKRLRESESLQEEFRIASRETFGSGRLCVEIEAAPEVSEWDNPLVEEVDPLPVIGTHGLVGLDYCYQVADLGIDFSPDPDDIGIGHGRQQFAATVLVCGGLACPEETVYEPVRSDYLQTVTEHGTDLSDDEMDELGLPHVPEAESLECFCLRVTVVGSVGTGRSAEEDAPGEWLRILQTPQLRIDDIALESDEEEFRMPDGLPGSITCYIRSFIEFTLVPQLNDTLTGIMPSLPADSLLAIDFEGTEARVSLPQRSGIPNNPAIEDDQLKVYPDLELRKKGGS